MNITEIRKKQEEIQAKRFEPIDRATITKIYNLIKSNFDTETALTVSLQLQQQEDYLRLKRKEHEDRFVKVSDKLREIADILDDND